jgi:ankyrin repeat protein
LQKRITERSIMAQQLETSLTKHKRPHLAKLLEAAKISKRGPLKRYLEAGGTPDAVVMLEQSENKIFKVPLLHSAVLNHHISAALAEGVEMLLNAGARIDTVGYAPNGSDRSCLMWAAELTCCTEPLKLLLQRGVDPCWQSQADGLSPLHMAAMFGPVAKCELLLQASGGRALNLRATEAGSTALSFAVDAGDVAVVKLLLRYGADLREVDVDMNTLLHTAAVADSSGGTTVPVLQYLLGLGLDVNAQQKHGLTPLNVAAQYGKAAAAQALLDHDADPTIPDADGYTPLQSAAADSVQNLPLLQCLLRSSRVDVNAVAGSTNKTALHMAVVNETECAAAVQLLLDHGADPCIKTSSGFDALVAATEQGNLSAVRVLLDYGMDITVTVRGQSYDGVTLLMVAAENGHIDVVKLLLERGADVNAVDSSGRNVLLGAALSSSADMLQLFLERGASAGKVSEHALLAAVLNDALQCAQLLIDSGTDVNATDCADEEAHCAEKSSLIFVMQAKTPAMVKLLLAAGADAHRTTASGNTCLHRAAACSYPAPVLCLLIKAGVDLHAVNSAGKTAAQVAHDKGNTLAAALLNRAAAEILK